MKLEKFEVLVHDHILRNDHIRKLTYGTYQRILYFFSPKIKSEGNITCITPDDEFEYLFGYYDKCPWSDDGKYLLALRVKNASLEADSMDAADIIRIELTTNEVTKLATTHSWNVQQGCMAQWLSNEEIIFNDFRDGKYCAVVLNLNTMAERVIGMPIYAMSQDRTTALTLDFSRLHRLRPGYGYNNCTEVTKNVKCPDVTCIWKIDIATGVITPVLKYSDFASFEPKKNMQEAEHKVNHLMISPNGKRFMVLHRWFQNGVKYTRLITCNLDGTEMYNLSDDDFVSHCCWKNDEEILAYLNKYDGGKGYYLMKDKTREYSRKWPELVMDGHPTFSYDGRCVVTDSYPNRTRMQSIYVASDKGVHRVARVFSPFKYGGNVRCDLHPRWSRDNREICFDAAFRGKRSVCVLKLSNEDLFDPKLSGTSKPKVCVVMATYNGEQYIREQIESLLVQKGVSVKILVRDDGSTDHTIEILNEYKTKGLLDWYSNGHLGVQKGFLDLLKKSDDVDYYAFCDQDDYWDDDKLLYAVSALESYGNDKPSLYYCGLRLVDDNLNYISTHKISNKRTPEANYYISNVAGCTCVFNRKLRDVVNEAEPDFILMHDSWIYKVCLSLGGRIFADPEAHISYRQHENNVAGMKKGRLQGIKKYINDFKIQKQMVSLKACYGSKMTDEYNKLTDMFICYDKSLVGWIRLLFYGKFDFKSFGLNGLARLKILFRKV